MTKNKIDTQKNILITGSNGFIGANLLRKLIADGYANVFVILRKDSNIWRIQDIMDKVTVSYVSLSDEQGLNDFIEQIKPDVIYHLAAAGAYIGRDGKGIKDLFETNVMGTINLINACQKVGFEYFVNTGTNSEYGQKDHPMKEDDLLEPNNEYGVTKSCGTMYAAYIGKKYQLPIYTFRPFQVFGYYEDKSRLIPSLMVNYAQGIAPQLSKPDSVRDYIFIDDVVDYYMNINKITGDFGGVYNIGAGIQYSIAEIAEKIKKIAEADFDPQYGSVTVKQNEPKVWMANMEKTHKAFQVTPTPIEVGLKKSFDRFKENQHLYT